MNPAAENHTQFTDLLESLLCRVGKRIQGFGLVSIDRNGKILEWSPGATSVTGYLSNDVLDRCLLDFLPAGLSTSGSGGLGAAADRPIWEEIQFVCSNNVAQRLLLGILPEPSCSSHEDRFIVFLGRLDPAPHENAIRKLGPALLEKLFNEAPQGMLVIRNGLTEYVNEGFCKMFGVADSKDVVGHPIQKWFAPEEQAVLRNRTFRWEMGFPEAKLCESYGMRTDGVVFPIHVQAARIELGEGVFIVCFFTNIRVRKEQERALRQSEARFRVLFEESPLGIAITGTGEGIFLNDALRRLMYLPPSGSQLKKGIEWKDLFGEEFGEFIAAALARRGGGDSGSDPSETRIRRSDGSLVPVRVEVAQIELPEGQATVAFVVDITEQVKNAEALQNAHQENERILSSIPSILVGWDDSERISLWNGAAERILGFPRKEVLGRSLVEFLKRDDWSLVREKARQCQVNGTPVPFGDQRWCRGDGEEILVGWTVLPFDGGPGSWKGYLFVGADVTERRRLEQQLDQAQRLESVGRLAAGIAHEINTPIQYVGDNTRFLSEAFSDLSKALEPVLQLLEEAQAGPVPPESFQPVADALKKADLEYLRAEIPAAVEQSLEGVDRVASIVRAMKEFSHPGQSKKAMVDINRAVQNTVTVARNEWKYVAEVKTDLADDLPLVPCYPGELNQVFLNVIVNAAQALGEKMEKNSPEKGIIDIRTRRRGDWVVISIADNGPGIPEKYQAKIFDPFFTTKEVGKGTGQGLAIAFQVIQKHQGRIFFESAEGRGTAFFFELPLGEPVIPSGSPKGAGKAD